MRKIVGIFPLAFLFDPATVGADIHRDLGIFRYRYRNPDRIRGLNLVMRFYDSDSDLEEEEYHFLCNPCAFDNLDSTFNSLEIESVVDS